MMILALEFSPNLRSVAIFDSAAEKILASVSAEYGQATGMALIDHAMRQAALETAMINRIVVGLGPGSNAGVRSAIAIAQGWQLGRSVEVVGMRSASGAEALARLGVPEPPVSASQLEPISLRETSFVKAPPPRIY